MKDQDFAQFGSSNQRQQPKNTNLKHVTVYLERKEYICSVRIDLILTVLVSLNCQLDTT